MTTREKFLLLLLFDTAVLMGGYLLGIAHAIDGIVP